MQKKKKGKQSKAERIKASTHSDMRAQQEGTSKNGKNAQDNRFLKERFLLSKEKKTDLKGRDKKMGERRLGNGKVEI